MESLLLAIGVERVVTFEYNDRSYNHPKISTVKYSSMREARAYRFDHIFSLSTFDHDGLGRYNDPVCPDADLRAMEIAKDMVKSNGLMFVSVPVGSDLLVWNSYRRYGAKRLPLFLNGWKVKRRFGWEESKMLETKVILPSYEPVLVLQVEQCDEDSILLKGAMKSS